MDSFSVELANVSDCLVGKALGWSSLLGSLSHFKWSVSVQHVSGHISLFFTLGVQRLLIPESVMTVVSQTPPMCRL